MSIFGKIIQPFLPHINFKEISPTDFFKKIKPFRNIFDIEFYVEIIEHYSFNNICSADEIDSKIIDSKSILYIIDWIRTMKQNQSVSYDFKLLVRGSRDGFETVTFHKCCDDKGPTITIARVKDTNEILGGFNPLSWISNDYYEDTKESFIFSLDQDNLTNSIFSKVVNKVHVVYNDSDYGPEFGSEKADLRLLYDYKKGQCYL